MTIVSSLFGASKTIEKEPTPAGEMPTVAPPPAAPSGATASRRVYRGTIFFRSSARRRRQRTNLNTTARYALIMIVTISIMMDMYVLLATDPKHPGQLAELTGFHSTVNIYVLLILHAIILWGGLSRTVFGCRIAATITWSFMMTAMGALLIVPAFIGSYVGSGFAPGVVPNVVANETAPSQSTANQRFQAAFYMALGGELFLFVVFLTTLFQLTVCAQLLAEAYVLREIEKAEQAQADAFLHFP